MPINFSKNTKQALDSLRNTLLGRESIIKIASNRMNRLGIAEAEIVGGNLSVLYSLIGSKSDIETD